MKKLYFDSKNSILFYIAGYCDNGSVDQVINNLRHGEQVLKTLTIPGKRSKIYCTKIDESRQYRNMHVFTCVINSAPPDEAEVLGGNWDMKTWILGRC